MIDNNNDLATNQTQGSLVPPQGPAWRRKMATHASVLPGESQGWGSLVGCRLWDRTESDTTEET